MTGDGLHAAFASSVDALIATVEIQKLLSEPEASNGIALRLRCGLHAGIDERRDGDFYGRAVNRAARIMCAAHGGQMLLSQAVADQVNGQLPEDVSLRDLGTVRLRDLSGPEHLYQVQHPQLRADFPALRSLEDTPNNLTQQLNSFIGRERELAEIKEMLATNRLVTLLGMGGIGKSRLSMQLAAEVLDDFPNGVWFVELAALTDPSSVAQAVASMLGVKEEAGRPVIEALTKYVRDLQVLIILDNCEQVIHGCADLAKHLLQAGANVKVLASSRNYLHVAGETAYHVPTLAVPDPQRPIDIEQLGRQEAVRLFVDRAAASRQGFALNVQNGAAVVDICHRLDGIPLAIELAAARVRALSVQAIAERLHDRFRLLVTSDQTVLPRQRTLRALIDWSYDLLSDAERRMFQRLAVFAGGWTLEAAEAVCAGEDLRKDDVLDLLSCLVEKSLVVTDVDGGRYWMLDTVRQYAHEKLAEAGDEAGVRARHLNFYLSVVEQARPQLLGSEQGLWLARLDAERENLLSAHAFCDQDSNGADFGLRLTFSLKFYWLNRGFLNLAFGMTVHALARPGAQSRDFSRSRGLCDAGQLCCFMGRYREAREFLEESLFIAREIGDTTRVAAVLQPLGMAALALGDSIQARRYSEESVALAREQGNKRQLAAAINALAQLHRAEKDIEKAKLLYEDVVLLSRELRDRQSIAIGLLNLAMVAIGIESGKRAPELLIEALTIAEEIGSKPAGQSALEVTAGLCAVQGTWTRAARLFGAADAQAEKTGLHRDAVDEAFLAPLVRATQEALGPRVFMAEEARGRTLSYEEAIREARRALQTEPALSIIHS